MKTFALFALALWSGVAIAQQPDPEFFFKASEAGIAEVEAGQVATVKAQSADVKAFANKLVEEYGKSNTKLATLAATKGVTLAITHGDEHGIQLRQLGGLSGPDFDAAYLHVQVIDQTRMAYLLEREINSGLDADVRALAREVLPMVRQHLTIAMELAAKSPFSGAWSVVKSDKP